MGGDLRHMYPSSVELDEEQHVEALWQYRFERVGSEGSKAGRTT